MMAGESQCPHGFFYPKAHCSRCFPGVTQLKALNKQLVEALRNALGYVSTDKRGMELRDRIHHALAAAKEMEE